MKSGMVFNIQRYALHDGPGIRTTVFLKGCPLNCWWCHNPESKGYKEQLIFNKNLCIECSACVQNCQQQALSFEEGMLIREEAACEESYRCQRHCPTGAIELVGKKMSVSELMQEIVKDQIFYDESKGGVTFSGGEPLTQHEFLYEVLVACKEKGIHTVLDTTGYVSWHILKKIAGLVDLFLYDVKHMNDQAHQQYTGVSNQLILENLAQLSRIHEKIVLRVPIIPGINDGENIREICEFAVSLHLKEVNIMAYHQFGIDKYAKINEIYRLPDQKTPTDEAMEAIGAKIKRYGLNVKIGG